MTSQPLLIWCCFLFQSALSSLRSVWEQAGHYRAERPALTLQLHTRPDVRVLVWTHAKMLFVNGASLNNTHTPSLTQTASWPTMTQWSALSVSAHYCELLNPTDEARKPAHLQPKTCVPVSESVWECVLEAHCVNSSLFWRSQITDWWWLLVIQTKAHSRRTCLPEELCFLFWPH